MQWLVDLIQNLIDFIYSLFISVLELVKDIVYWFFDLIMNIVDSLLSIVISLFEPIDISQYMGGFPPQASWVLSQIGLPQAIAMIVVSLGVRLLLQLVPFTRLGS
ncbi:VSK receptor [Vibrio breoganii]